MDETLDKSHRSRSEGTFAFPDHTTVHPKGRAEARRSGRARRPTRQVMPIRAPGVPPLRGEVGPRMPKPSAVAGRLVNAYRTSVDGGQPGVYKLCRIRPYQIKAAAARWRACSGPGRKGPHPLRCVVEPHS